MNYGLFVIKPDGIRRGIERDFKDFLYARKIKIISEVEYQLKDTDVKNNFFFQATANVDYLCSCPVKAFFVEINGRNAIEKIYSTKMEFRLRYNIYKNEFFNLIHSADEGLEFYLQRKLFFSKYNSPDYTIGTDMLMECGNECKLEKKLSSISAVCVVIRSYSMLTELKKNYKITIRPVFKKRLVFDRVSVNVYYYYNDFPNIKSLLEYDDFIENLPLTDCTIVLGEIQGISMLPEVDIIKDINSPVVYLDTIYNFFEKEMDDIIQKVLNYCPISGMLVDSATLSIQEVSCRFFYADDHCYKKAAGSGSEKIAGFFSVSKEYFDNFYR